MKRAGEMNGNGQPDLRPKVRFSEFEGDGAWHTETIGEISEPIKEKVGEHKITPVSITAGVGFVRQADKFGRDISGEQYKNYTYLRRGDFAYNKGNSKSFPEGYVCQLQEFDEVAASSAFICFKLKDGYEAKFLKGLFDRNTHGRQLAAHITSGARSNGLLNLNAGQFYSVRLPFPPNFEEQERIAECLASVEALIEAETEKLDALKDHKQGLMQQLFPAEGEDLPKRRFPEFANEGAWEEKPIDQLCKPFSGGTPPTSRDEYYGGEIPFIRSAEIALERTELFLTPEGLANSAAKLVSPGDVLIALYGANSGEVAVSKIEGAINQAILCLQVGPDSEFVAQYWSRLKHWIVSTYIQGGQGNISGEIVKSIELKIPRNPSERLKVSRVLMAADKHIESQKNRIKHLRLHKQGLLQQLFPVLDGVDG